MSQSELEKLLCCQYSCCVAKSGDYEPQYSSTVLSSAVVLYCTVQYWYDTGYRTIILMVKYSRLAVVRSVCILELTVYLSMWCTVRCNFLRCQQNHGKIHTTGQTFFDGWYWW